MSSQEYDGYVDERDVRGEPEGFWNPRIPGETVTNEEIISFRPKPETQYEQEIKDLKDKLARSELNAAAAFSQGREVGAIDARVGTEIARFSELQAPSIGAHACLTSKTRVFASSGSKAPLVRSEEDHEVANLESQLASCKAKVIATKDSLEKALVESQASREKLQQDLAELKKEGAREVERLGQQFAADIRERERAHHKAIVSLNEVTNKQRSSKPPIDTNASEEAATLTQKLARSRANAKMHFEQEERLLATKERQLGMEGIGAAAWKEANNKLKQELAVLRNGDAGEAERLQEGSRQFAANVQQDAEKQGLLIASLKGNNQKFESGLRNLQKTCDYQAAKIRRQEKEQVLLEQVTSLKGRLKETSEALETTRSRLAEKEYLLGRFTGEGGEEEACLKELLRIPFNQAKTMLDRIYDTPRDAPWIVSGVILGLPITFVKKLYMVAGRGQPYNLKTRKAIAIDVLRLEADDLADNIEDEETLTMAVAPTAVATMVAPTAVVPTVVPTAAVIPPAVIPTVVIPSAVIPTAVIPPVIIPTAVIPMAATPTAVAQPAPAPAQPPPPTQPVVRGRWWARPLFLTWMMFNILTIILSLLTISTRLLFIPTTKSSMGQENTRDWLWQDKQIKISLLGPVHQPLL